MLVKHIVKGGAALCGAHVADGAAVESALSAPPRELCADCDEADARRWERVARRADGQPTEYCAAR